MHIRTHHFHSGSVDDLQAAVIRSHRTWRPCIEPASLCRLRSQFTQMRCEMRCVQVSMRCGRRQSLIACSRQRLVVARRRCFGRGPCLRRGRSGRRGRRSRRSRRGRHCDLAGALTTADAASVAAAAVRVVAAAVRAAAAAVRAAAGSERTRSQRWPGRGTSRCPRPETLGPRMPLPLRMPPPRPWLKLPRRTNLHRPYLCPRDQRCRPGLPSYHASASYMCPHGTTTLMRSQRHRRGHLRRRNRYRRRRQRQPLGEGRMLSSPVATPHAQRAPRVSRRVLPECGAPRP